jgi:hypothetical protein
LIIKGLHRILRFASGNELAKLQQLCNTSRMKSTGSRKAYATVQFARETVSIYRRKRLSGTENFMVANYSSGKRWFDSYPSEAQAREAALKLAKQLSKRQIVAACMTNAQVADYAAAVELLAPFNIPVPAAVAGLAKPSFRGKTTPLFFYSPPH